MKKTLPFFVFAVFVLPLTALAQQHKSAKMSMGQPHDKMDMGHHPMAMGMSGMDALKGLSGKEFNIAFLSQMIAHHRGAIEMAQQALEVAKHAETKKEAEMVITNQKKEITLMTGWLQKWYGVKPSQEQVDKVKADMKGMMSMKITTDRMFFEMMMPHHQGAIDMSELALKQSDKVEVKQLAHSIIKAQKAEIARYKTLLNHVG